MIHVICHDFKSTSGNHAGMRYLYEQICKNDSNTRLYVLNKKGVGVRYLNRLIAFFVALKVALTYKKGDKILFTEHLFGGSFHVWMISVVRFFHPKALIYAMAHLTPLYLEQRFTKSQIRKEAAKVNCVITLGSSLTHFLKGLGIKNVHTSFHYVDNSYYTVASIEAKPAPTIIVMGAMARKFNMLADIVKKCPTTDFVICKGRKNVDDMFAGCKNVKLLGFVPEDTLKHEMSMADISLNVMEDTVGSNVICTSLGMGLAMLCSDVGSIRDYCNESNTVFCKTTDDFVDAIKMLSGNPDRLDEMRKNAYAASKKLSIANYKKDIWQLMGETDIQRAGSC